MDNDRETAERQLQESVRTFTVATNHGEPQFSAEAYYNRSKSHWRLSRLNDDKQEFLNAVKDAEEAAQRSYDHRFTSWYEFLRENSM